MTDVTPDETELDDVGSPRLDIVAFVRRNPTVTLGSVLLLAIVLMAIFAPLIAPGDPQALDPVRRLRPPSRDHWFGTDMYGRDVFARTIHGSRISLIVGALVALISVGVGLAIGLVTGYVRALDGVIMRIMDGLMAIPGILLAIGLVSLFRAGLGTVIFAIVVPEIPRVVRLVRSVVLSVREEPYVEAAISVGTPLPKILWRHILPNTIAPVIVQGTFICGSAILAEATLSFLGLGPPPPTPTWGSMINDGSSVLQPAPWVVLFPGLAITLTVLGFSLVGDGIRDALDTRLRDR